MRIEWKQDQANETFWIPYDNHDLADRPDAVCDVRWSARTHLDEHPGGLRLNDTFPDRFVWRSTRLRFWSLKAAILWAEMAEEARWMSMPRLYEAYH